MVGTSIHHALMKAVPTEHRWKLTLLMKWPTIIGKLADKVVLEAVTADTIVLAVAHSGWAQELHFLTPVLKQRVSECLGDDRIKHVRLKIADFGRRPKRTGEAHSNKPTRSTTDKVRPATRLSHAQKRRLSGVQNAELRSYLEGYAHRCKRHDGAGESEGERSNGKEMQATIDGGSDMPSGSLSGE